MFSLFCLQYCSCSEYKIYFTLQFKSVNSSTYNIQGHQVTFSKHYFICKYISNLCWVCFFLQWGHHRVNVFCKCVLYMYLVHFSLKNFRRLSVNIQLPFFVENKQLFTLNLTYGWLEMNRLWFFCSGLVLRLAEKGWVAMVEFVTL